MKYLKYFLANLEECIAGACLVFLIGLTVANVLLRAIFRISITWAEEMDYALYAWVIFLGAGAALKRGNMSAIDLLVNLIPEKGRKVVVIATECLMIVMCAFLCVLSIQLCQTAIAKWTPILHISYVFVDASCVVAFGLMVVHLIFIIRRILREGTESESLLYPDMQPLEQMDEASCEDHTPEITDRRKGENRK